MVNAELTELSRAEVLTKLRVSPEELASCTEAFAERSADHHFTAGQRSACVRLANAAGGVLGLVQGTLLEPLGRAAPAADPRWPTSVGSLASLAARCRTSAEALYGDYADGLKKLASAIDSAVWWGCAR
jgi:hypothetical protein